jgi:nucleoside-diphosphate-sugar epimerase
VTSKPASILVTGGTGFFGSSLVRHLIAAGHSVKILTRNGTPSVHPRISMHKGDITCLKDLRGAMQGCSAVFHCAAEKENPAQMLAINVFATRMLFDLAANSDVKFFCHLSSVGVTGKTVEKVVDESTSCNPMNKYEETKLAAEEEVNQGLDSGKVVILRPTNIFGPGTLRLWMRNSLRLRMRLLLKGNEHAHFVYVEDAAAAAVYMLDAFPCKSVETYIVSSDEEEGNTYKGVQAYLASKIQTASFPLGFSAPLFVPYFLRRIKHGPTNLGDVIYSSRKLRETGFVFPYGLQMGLNEAVGAIKNSLSLL